MPLQITSVSIPYFSRKRRWVRWARNPDPEYSGGYLLDTTWTFIATGWVDLLGAFEEFQPNDYGLQSSQIMAGHCHHRRGEFGPKHFYCELPRNVSIVISVRRAAEAELSPDQNESTNLPTRERSKMPNSSRRPDLLRPLI